MAACGVQSTSDSAFLLDPETCSARHPAGVTLRQPLDAPERLTLSVDGADAGPAILRVGARPVLTLPLATGGDGVASVTLPDARVFWSSFGQADQLAVGDLSIRLADQAGLRDAMAACRQSQDGGA